MTDTADLIARLGEGEDDFKSLFKKAARLCGVPTSCWWTRNENTQRIGRFVAAGAWLDACRALQAEVLPGWAWFISDDGDATLYPPGFSLMPDSPSEVSEDGLPSPERAWLIAILRAVEAGNG